MTKAQLARLKRLADDLELPAAYLPQHQAVLVARVREDLAFLRETAK